MNFEIIDNFLSPSYFKEIQDILMSNHFPWRYHGNITDRNDNSNLYSFGFAHNFYEDGGVEASNFSIFFKPLFLQIKDLVKKDQIYRARADMTVYSLDGYRHSPHVDLFLNKEKNSYLENVTSIFYVNESDGNTVLYNEKLISCNDKVKEKNLTIMQEINPIPNRLLIFDGRHIHTGHSPQKHKNRILINSNYV